MDQNYPGMPPTPDYQNGQTQTANQPYGQPYGQPNGQPNGQQGYQTYQQYQQQGYADFTGQGGQNGSLVVNDYARMHLRSIGGWTKFISIVSIVMITLYIGLFIYMMTLPDKLIGSDYYGAAKSTMTGVIIFYIVILAIFYLPCIWGVMAGSKMKQAAVSNNPNDLEEGLRKWKYVCLFVGVLTIIGLALVVLGLAFGFLGTLLAR